MCIFWAGKGCKWTWLTDCAFCDSTGEEPKQFFSQEQPCGDEEQRAQPRLRWVACAHLVNLALTSLSFCLQAKWTRWPSRPSTWATWCPPTTTPTAPAAPSRSPWWVPNNLSFFYIYILSLSLSLAALCRGDEKQQVREWKKASPTDDQHKYLAIQHMNTHTHRSSPEIRERQEMVDEESDWRARSLAPPTWANYYFILCVLLLLMLGYIRGEKCEEQPIVRRAHMCLGSFIFCVSALPGRAFFARHGHKLLSDTWPQKENRLGITTDLGKSLARRVETDCAYLFLISRNCFGLHE